MVNFSPTISTSFFDNLWPLILKNIDYDITNEKTKEFFVPQRQCVHLWSHELLARNGFQNNGKPTELKCGKEMSPMESNQKSNQQLPYNTPVPEILPLDQQLAIIQNDVAVRQKLANDFVNRKFPWYIQRPTYKYDFIINEEMKNHFKEPLEYAILRNIQLFKCNVMIINVAPFVDLKYLERWLKFSPYVTIITVVHNATMFRQLNNFKNIFQVVRLEENLQNTWQEELNRSLKLGVNHAKQSGLLNDSGRPFVFVFSTKRGICVCDEFKILRKF